MSPWWLKPTGEASEEGAQKDSKSDSQSDKKPGSKKGADSKKSKAIPAPKPVERVAKAPAPKMEAVPAAEPTPKIEKPSGPPTILDTLSEPEPLFIPEMPKPDPASDGSNDGAGEKDKPSRPRRSRRGGKKSDKSSDDGASSQTSGKKREPKSGSSSGSRRGGRRRKAPANDAVVVAADHDGSLSDLSYGLATGTGTDEARIAVFCDLENVALGVRDSEIKKFDIGLVLERLVEKGRIIVKRAYSDWERYSEYKRPFHEAAIELIDIPQKHYSGKNSADIKMVVDAMELCYANEHINTFVILSGDSDFSPLVSKLREANKNVIGVGVKNSSSQLLISNCDEFIYYEDVWRDAQKAPSVSNGDVKNADAFKLMADSIKALMRENKDVLWGSMVKQTMQRKQPSFSEGYYGYSTFSELLEDAEKQKLINLERDRRSGSYIVRGLGS